MSSKLAARQLIRLSPFGHDIHYIELFVVLARNRISFPSREFDGLDFELNALKAFLRPPPASCDGERLNTPQPLRGADTGEHKFLLVVH